MIRRLSIALAALAPAFAPALATAQVGHAPENSPYLDVPQATRFGAFAGWYSAAKDAAGVFPQSKPVYGLRIDTHIGGPADLTGRVALIETNRHVIDPVQTAGHRVIETQKITLTYMDVGLTMNLSGKKSWRGFVPAVFGAVGIVSDYNQADVGGFAIGTTFSLGYGLSMRYLPRNSRVALQASVGSYLYSIRYPDSYYVQSSDGTSVLGANEARTQWHNNWTTTFGLSYAVFK